MKQAPLFFSFVLALEVTLVGAGSLQSTVGTYECVAYRGGHIVDRFKSVNTLWKAWMRVAATDEATGPGGPDLDQIYVGYDAAAKRWNIVGVDSSGTYWARHSTSANYDGSRWIDDYPRDGGRAIVRVIGDGARYTFDLTTPKANGGSDVSHTVCTRTTRGS